MKYASDLKAGDQVFANGIYHTIKHVSQNDQGKVTITCHTGWWAVYDLIDEVEVL